MEAYRTKLKGKVAWFDDIAGKGFIQGEDGELYQVHYSTIKSNDSHKTLTKGQEVEFTLYKAATCKRVAEIKVS